MHFLSFSEDKNYHEIPWFADTTHNKGLKLASKLDSCSIYVNIFISLS